MTSWDDIQVLKREELPEYYWHKGFFTIDFGNRKQYRRDFEELRYRDIGLFSLGEIKGKKILDVGCGDGLYTLTFLKLGAEFVAGQDISPTAVEAADRTCKKNGFNNFQIKTGNCEQLLFEDDYFDLVFSGDVFEHISYQQKVNFINEIYRVLKPGGILTVKTPNKSYLKVSNLLRRFKALASFKNPFNIHIPHTRNNPNNEHHGLTTYRELKGIFKKTMFHEPIIYYQKLNRKGLPGFLGKMFLKAKFFNAQIVLSVKKSYFFGVYK
jgi:ubiquinone/menaquinone biosynthesis C-methylase UbiE